MSNFKIANILDKLKDIFWPIKRSEIKLFVPLGFMMLCMLFNFGALRSIKDSLVVPNIGAEVISFLKLWLVLPSTVIFTLIYVKLSNICNYEYLFYFIVSFFLGFFILFTYVIFPQQQLFHPDEATINNLVTIYPNCKWFIKIIGKWSYALMYVFCELWSVVIINLLFWQYANHIFDTRSAKRFYPFLGFIGNFGLIMAGNVLIYFSDLPDAHIIFDYNDIHFQSTKVLQPIMNLIIIFGVVAMGLYAYVERYVINKMSFNKRKILTTNKVQNSLSFRESLKLLMQSKYIGHIVLLVLCYGLLINILEGPWKSKVRELYPNTVDYIHFMGQFNIWMGISSVLFMVIGSNILRKFSWVKAALMTPYMLTATGLIFFIFVIFDQYINFGNSVNPLYIAVIIGAVQNILSKSTKYSLFDSTKEMAYIPLSVELKTKGKAAVEVIGLKFGKSLGAFVQSFLFIIMPMATFDSIAVYLLAIFIVVMALWIWNVGRLNREYLKLQGVGNEDH